MTLREWLKQKGLTQTEAARLLGVTQPYISQWVNGTVPDPKNILRIEEASGGKVTLRDWVKLERVAKAG